MLKNLFGKEWILATAFSERELVWLEREKRLKESKRSHRSVISSYNITESMCMYCYVASERAPANRAPQLGLHVFMSLSNYFGAVAVHAGPLYREVSFGSALIVIGVFLCTKRSTVKFMYKWFFSCSPFSFSQHSSELSHQFIIIIISSSSLILMTFKSLSLPLNCSTQDGSGINVWFSNDLMPRLV